MFFHLLHIIFIKKKKKILFFFFFFFFKKTHYHSLYCSTSCMISKCATPGYLFIVKHIKLTKSYLCSCGCLSDKRVGSMFIREWVQCLQNKANVLKSWHFLVERGVAFVCWLRFLLLLLFFGSCCFFIHVLDSIIHTSLLVHKPVSFCINISQDSCIL